MSISSMFSSNRAWKILEVVATQDSFLQFIREKGRITGKLHLVLRDGRHFLESEEATLLTHLCNAVRGVAGVEGYALYLEPKIWEVYQTWEDIIKRLKGFS